MADEILSETDGDEDFVIIEEPQADDTVPAADGEDTTPAAAGADQAAEDDDDDDDDARLGANEDDTEEGLTPNQIKRKKRREMARRAREAKDQELADLRAFRATAEPRLAALEQNAVGVNATVLETKLIEARRTRDLAESIRLKAEEAGSVSDAMQAFEARRQAEAEIAALEPAVQHLKNLREQPQQTHQPAGGAAPVDYAAAWQAQNAGWYKDGGMDDASVLTRQIAAQLKSEGMDGNTLGFWQELTKRIQPYFATDDAPAAKPATAERTGRKTPPTGSNRELATPSTKQREVRLSSERIQAIKDAGKWDDPVERNRMVRKYMDYDRNHAAGQQGVS